MDKIKCLSPTLAIKNSSDSGFRKFSALSKFSLGGRVRSFEKPYDSHPNHGELRISKMNRKEVLEEKGIKQTWLTEKLSRNYNMVNAYVQNRQQPRLEVLYSIAEILEVDVKELLKSNKEIKE